jgi:ATP-dependent DNA ligase
LIVRRDGPTVRLYTSNAYDWTVRLPAIAAAAQRITARSFTIDGEAVVLGADGLSRFDDLRRRVAARAAVLYAFDLIEHDGEDLRDLPFLDRKAALARLLRDTEAGILLNEHVAEDGPRAFAHACRLGAEGMISKKVDATYRPGPCLAWVKAPQSGQHRAAAGAQRKAERMIRDFPDAVAGPGLGAPRPRRLIDLVIQLAVAVAATLIRTANPRRLGRPSASAL